MQRPISLTIIAWLLILDGAWRLVNHVMADANPVVAGSPLPAFAHIVVAVVGAVVSVASGGGILMGRDWSRFLFLSWSLLALVFALFTVPVTQVLLINLAITAIIVFFLFRPAANRWFTGSATLRKATDADGKLLEGEYNSVGCGALTLLVGTAVVVLVWQTAVPGYRPTGTGASLLFGSILVFVGFYRIVVGVVTGRWRNRS